MKDYGFYSTVVFQMLGTIALGFWGGNWLKNYFELQSNLLTVGIGFLAMIMALYNTILLLKQREKRKQK